MSGTIGNPGTWVVDHLDAAGHHIGSVVTHVGHGDAGEVELPEVRHIDMDDVRAALRAGVADFAACRSDVAFLAIIYPLVGLLLAWFALDHRLVPLLFPLISGFALLGPIAAIGLYEMSRRRETGEAPRWSDALSVTRSPSFGAILLLGMMLGATFLVWMMTAHGIWNMTLGPEAPDSLGSFLRDALTTGPGWAMIVIGCAVGFLFAAVVLAGSVVSFPLLLDRYVGLPAAIITSMRVAAANPGPIAAWGFIVAAGLVLGSLPFFLGLIVVMPILGHATWHLYRRAVVDPTGRPPER